MDAPAYKRHLSADDWDVLLDSDFANSDFIFPDPPADFAGSSLADVSDFLCDLLNEDADEAARAPLAPLAEGAPRERPGLPRRRRAAAAAARDPPERVRKGRGRGRGFGRDGADRARRRAS